MKKVKRSEKTTIWDLNKSFKKLKKLLDNQLSRKFGFKISQDDEEQDVMNSLKNAIGSNQQQKNGSGEILIDTLKKAVNSLEGSNNNNQTSSTTSNDAAQQASTTAQNGSGQNTDPASEMFKQRKVNDMTDAEVINYAFINQPKEIDDSSRQELLKRAQTIAGEQLNKSGLQHGDFVKGLSAYADQYKKEGGGLQEKN